MITYKDTPVTKLKNGDLLDLSKDIYVCHHRNSETAVPAMLDRLEYDFLEVLDVTKGFESVTILTQWGDLTFPNEHQVPVFVEA